MTRLLRCLPAALLLLGSVLPLAAADPAPTPVNSHWDVGTEIKFDFDRGRITTPLPFDVMFFLQAKVPPPTKEGKAKIGTKVPNAPCTPVTELQAAIVKLPEGSDKVPYLEVAVDPALQYGKSYCFAFDILRERTEEEAKKIVPRIAMALAGIYKETNPMALAEGTAFRRELYLAVRNAVGPLKLVLPTGSILVPPADEEAKGLVTTGAAAEAEWKVERPPLGIRMLLARPEELRQQAKFAMGNYLGRHGEIAGLDRDPIDVDSSPEAIRGEIAALLEEKPKLKKADARALVDEAIFSLREAAARLEEREESITAVAIEFEKALVDHYDIHGSTQGDFATRFNWYVSADLGIGVAPETDDFFEYLGVNVYLRPINKKAPLSGLDFRKRFAFVIGVTRAELDSDHRVGLVAKRAVLLGGGFRVTDHFRIAVGGEFFHAEDPSPLIGATEKSLEVTPFISASIDVDVAGMFRNLFKPVLP